MLVNNDNLERQRTDIAINTRRLGGTVSDTGILPYDPTDPPDADSTTIVSAPNFIDNSDLDYSVNDYTASGAGDDDYECYNFYRQRFIKLTDVVATNASNAITSAAGKFKSTY